MSFSMIDAIASIEIPAVWVFWKYAIVNLYLLIKYKSKNFSCLVKFLLRFIFNKYSQQDLKKNWLTKITLQQ